MPYDFDRYIDRRGTNSLKWDFAVERGKPADVLPLWVADMDFPAPECVLEALRKAVDHGIFGYSEVKGSYFDAVAAWFSERFGFTPEAEWLVKTPGVVFALAAAVRALTDEGDAVMIQTPVYYPFYEVIRDNGRTVTKNELVLKDGRYEIDFADFEEKIRENRVKLFILCSPHNPVGRVWSQAELEEMGRICERHGVTVVSDEIHCDFAFPEHPHTVFLDACPQLAERTLVCTAPSKSFNLAGLQVSNLFIPSAEIRQKIRREMDRTGYSQLNALGLVAAEAAYRGGAPWLDACRDYLRENLAYLRAFLARRIPEIALIEPEGTYFAWLDMRGLGLSDAQLDELITYRAKLFLDAGHIFGPEGSGFQRMVLACPRATLDKALCRLEAAVRGPQ